jgi:hypothetical protein
MVDAKRTTRRTRVARATKPEMPYIGGKRYKSIGNMDTGTNEEHVQLTLKEMPSLRMAVAMLNKDDQEMEAAIRGADERTVTAFTDFADTMERISGRHQAVINMCTAARVRIMIVIDRCLRGPKPAPWAGKSV